MIKIVQPRDMLYSVPKKLIHFCLLYTGTHSPQKNRLRFLAFARQPFAPKHSKGLRSCVVYSFKCRYCSSSHMRQTVRHLDTLMSEHLGISPLTRNKSNNPRPASINESLTILATQHHLMTLPFFHFVLPLMNL